MSIEHLKVGIVQYPGVMQSAVIGLQEMFFLANAVCRQNAQDHHFEVTIYDYGQEPGKETHLKADVEQCQDPPLHNETLTGTNLQVLIIPPRIADDYYLFPATTLTSWIKTCHQQGAIICSVCAGTFILAATGLLHQRRATTHWDLVPTFQERYSTTQLESHQLLINDGDIITAGGLMAWMDLGLELVAQFTQPSLMHQLGKYMIIDTGRREQRYYQTFTPKLNHGDDAILKVQHYIHSHLNQPLSVKILLEQCFLSERTFLRRFVNATNWKPRQYIQRLRVQRACELIETTHDSFESISKQVGYEDNSAFRKTFIKFMGLTPRDFQSRFAN